MATLLKICEALQCNFDGVVEIIGLQSESAIEEQGKTVAKEVKSMHRTSPPRLVSLFSGCGGMDKGFEDAGYQRVWANDFDADAQAVFKINLGEIDGRDITKVPVEDIPDCDIITAGFPCQPFSNAGNRRGVYDSRGELYLECLRIIESKKPRVVLFENVKGLLSSKHQSGKKLIEVIREDLEKLGYRVNYKVVNASNYGVPQNRERMILIGFREDLNKTFEFPPEQEDKSKLTLRNILDIPSDAPNQTFWPYSPQAQSMIEQIPEGGSWKSIPYENLPPRFQRIRDDMKRYHAPNFYRRFSRDEINGTITASAQPENCGITHPTENRRYTIREIARIQTFPDDFIFIDETLKDIVAMYKVIGNAVPCHLAEVIADAIYNQAFSEEVQ
ncbi:MAG: DNA cytosine methyltransferase [Lachnospiraceae bacterium]|nr:DNA cytosine methyltransferase [Lachnospiraceae bacterium]